MTIPGIQGGFFRGTFVKDFEMLRVTPGEDKPADPFLDCSTLLVSWYEDPVAD